MAYGHRFLELCGVSQYILGVRPSYDGLTVDPCIPCDWEGFRVRRVFRGKVFDIEVKNPDRVSKGVASLAVNGRKLDGTLIPFDMMQDSNNVEVVLGR